MSCSRQFARSLALKNQPRRVLSCGSGRGALFVLPRTMASFSTANTSSSSSTSTTTTNNNDTSQNGSHTTLPPSNPSSSTTSSSSTTTSMTTDPRQALLQAALVQVPEHGWTRQAIVAAVPQAFPGASLSMAGQITPSDMVAYCMDEWNTQLYKELTRTNKDSSLSIAQALQRRLEYQVPLVQCGRWQQAMAMGLTTPEKTYHQLHTLIQTVLSHAQQQSTTSSSSSHSTTTAQLTLGGIYVATELHLLADTSANYQDTWQFLQQRVHEWETGTSHTSTTSLLSSLPSTSMPFANPAMASTVASALASGFASVLFHNNAASSLSTTNPSTSSSSIDGTDPRHYQTPTAPAPASQPQNPAKQS